MAGGTRQANTRQARTWPIFAALALAAFVALGGSWVAYDKYGGEALWPGLIGNFVASLAAFILALSWERSREQKQQLADAEAARVKVASEEETLEERRATELRRRLEPVRDELKRTAESLDTLAKGFEDEATAGEFRALHPQLLDGAWTANAPRLTELIADYQLTSDLSTAYGRIEELRWRMRQRTATLVQARKDDDEPPMLATALSGITAPLVEELIPEVGGLIERVGKQIDNPDVQPLGLMHVDSGMVYVRLGASGSA